MFILKIRVQISLSDRLLGYESSISAAILFHFMFNLFSVLLQTEQFTKCIITVILLIIAVVIILRDQEEFLEQANTRPSVALKTVYACSRNANRSAATLTNCINQK